MNAVQSNRVRTVTATGLRWVTAVTVMAALSGCYTTRTVHHTPVRLKSELTHVELLPEGSLRIGCDCQLSTNFDEERLREVLCFIEPDDGNASPLPELVKIEQYRHGAGRQYCDALKLVTGNDAKCWEPKPPIATSQDPCNPDIGEAQRQLDRLVCARVCNPPPKPVVVSDKSP